MSEQYREVSGGVTERSRKLAQITEELESVKQEMDERGSSMTDGSMSQRVVVIVVVVLYYYYCCYYYYYYYYYYYCSNILGKHKIKELQLSAILDTAHVLRKLLM